MTTDVEMNKTMDDVLRHILNKIKTFDDPKDIARLADAYHSIIAAMCMSTEVAMHAESHGLGSDPLDDDDFDDFEGLN